MTGSPRFAGTVVNIFAIATAVARYAVAGLVLSSAIAHVDWVIAAAGRMPWRSIEFAVDPELVEQRMIFSRVRGWASVTLRMESYGGKLDDSADALIERAAKDTWSAVGNGVAFDIQGLTVPRRVYFQGWPFAAFRANDRTEMERNFGYGEIQGGFKVRGGFPERVIAFRPIWGGLIANTAIFGGGLWLIIHHPVKLRRVYRRRRGLCESCGYSLEGLSGVVQCPECGGDGTVQPRSAPHFKGSAGHLLTLICFAPALFAFQVLTTRERYGYPPAATGWTAIGVVVLVWATILMWWVARASGNISPKIRLAPRIGIGVVGILLSVAVVYLGFARY